MAESTSDQDLKTENTETNEPGLTGLLLKDLALVFGALSLWAAADTWYTVTGLWLAQLVAVGDAIVVGLLLAGLFHEWGHYTGSAVAGASVRRVSSTGFSLLRFNFDYDQNDHRQFHWMTYGGHIFHWAILILLLLSLPLDSLGRIALVSSVFGFIVFASFIEYNIVKDTWAGVDPKTRLEALTTADFQRSAMIGGLGGLFAMAALA